jgi:pyruvate dehydrogenase E1 component beta subunit
MAEITYRDAVARGIAQEMTRDPDVVFLGEDVAKAGGVFKATVGLYEQFGPLRVKTTTLPSARIADTVDTVPASERVSRA